MGLQSRAYSPADPVRSHPLARAIAIRCRKAVAEPVQNSIDAHLRHVVVSRRRLRGGPALIVRDDGEGVLPDLGREEAIRYIATNIGSSRKRSLSAEQRRRLVVTGQHGVGLLGFWSVAYRARALPGEPLAKVIIAPHPVEVAPGHEHRARALARDDKGRLIRQGVIYRCSVEDDRDVLELAQS
jgi:Histidine kinase-, DNA gyrase B-, and HSP90-like ATPase